MAANTSKGNLSVVVDSPSVRSSVRFVVSRQESETPFTYLGGEALVEKEEEST